MCLAITKHAVKCAKYAQVSKWNIEVEVKILCNLTEIIWCIADRLYLNLDKTKIMIFTANHKNETNMVFGRPYYRSSLWYTVLSVCLSVVCHLSVICNVLYCGETVRPSEKVSEGVNRKPGSKSSFWGSPPYFYFRFRRYGHQDCRFCLIFARIAQQSVLYCRN